ncbi:MAG TPA: FtsX-like permease family protein [Thermoanaerobaculia bacterium]|nr:FtsX-like permease family protein [Thermoanaerobaculia bacterium]
MIRHLFKLVWNRKRANALLILEIFIAFLVLFVVATSSLYYWDSYRRPLGFDSGNVWDISLMVNDSGFHWIPGQREGFSRLLEEIAALPQVEGAASVLLPPFGLCAATTQGFRGRVLWSEYEEVMPGFDRVMGLHLVAGRWFRPGDEGLSWKPVVIDQDLARDAFAGKDPVGQVLFPPDPATREPEMRVIGVISEFRMGGELSGTGKNFFFKLRPEEPWMRPPHHLLVKLRPGTPESFEKELYERLQRAAPGWSFQITPLAQLREAALRSRLGRLVLGGTLAFFLLMMVALGLIGVLWQNLLQRTREFGLRRATGASGPQVRRQVLMEQLFLTGLGLLLGTLLVVQLPLLGFAGFLSPEVFTAGLLTTLATMLFLTLACASYPSWRTSRIPPAEALRYE